MLILTRRPGERVVIGDEILVTVMGVSGHTVRLGIAAPAGVPIYREEIWLAVREENRAARPRRTRRAAQEAPRRGRPEAGRHTSRRRRDTRRGSPRTQAPETVPERRLIALLRAV